MCDRGPTYRGRLAPSPSGHLHVGHAQTFYIAKERARAFGGDLLLRVEDIDVQRCKPQFLTDMMEDLEWFGLKCDLGYGSHSATPADYIQSMRFGLYKRAWRKLYEMGVIYPCSVSRRDVAHALSAPQQTDEPITGPSVTGPSAPSPAHDIPNEPVFPRELRPDFVRGSSFFQTSNSYFPPRFQGLTEPDQLKINWRFRVPDIQSTDRREAEEAIISYKDNCCGHQSFTAMEDFGDFLVWRLDGYPSYELAVVVDDIIMGISEVVRGRDLLISTARQLLLMNALFDLDFRNEQCWHNVPSIPPPLLMCESMGSAPKKARLSSSSLTEAELLEHGLTHTFSEHSLRIPRYYHVPLMCDEFGKRLAKRNFAKSLRKMREEGLSVEDIHSQYFHKDICSHFSPSTAVAFVSSTPAAHATADAPSHEASKTEG